MLAGLVGVALRALWEKRVQVGHRRRSKRGQHLWMGASPAERLLREGLRMGKLVNDDDD